MGSNVGSLLDALLPLAAAGAGAAFGLPPQLTMGAASFATGITAPATPGGGGGGLLNSLTGTGPGRGQIRRTSARAAVDQNGALTALRLAVQRENASGFLNAAEIATTVHRMAAQNPQIGQTLLALIARAQQLGGIGSAQGNEANTLGDVFKYVFGLGTVRRPGSPSASDVLAVLRGGMTNTGPSMPPPNSGVPSTAPQAAQIIYSPAMPAGAPQVLSTSFQQAVGGPNNMPSILDAISAGVGGLAQSLPGILSATLQGSQQANSPFVLPGGAGSPVFYQDTTMLGPSSGFDVGMQNITSPFRLTAAGARAQLHVAVNPASGRVEYFGPLGHPVLFSRDLAVVKRVRKISSRFGSAVGLRRRMVRRRGRR